MRIIFSWTIFACIFMSMAWCIACKKYGKKSKGENNLVVDNETDINNEITLKLEINRRLAHNKL